MDTGDWRQRPVTRASGTAYVKPVRTRDRDGKRTSHTHGPADPEALSGVLAAFASASGKRRGCPPPP
ncbi:hypothetical protein [Streptomyces sp. enrichment culture]|uniref:hypothetical protein n=1 Tax=Streptomyces sp. enrichment culture TaxID=1795815 RepID=UPI003F549CFE